tara:strand:- start:191 stop:439 length:249 start_codon:yes stop_codon:yes gene_type:complete
MPRLVENFIFQIIGAFFFWAIKGFKGKLDYEMTGPYESGPKRIRNFLTALIILGIGAAVVLGVQKQIKKRKQPSDTMYYYPK